MFKMLKIGALLLVSVMVGVITFSIESGAQVYTDDGYVSGGKGTGEKMFSPEYKRIPCVAAGYSLTNCVGNLVPANFCPTDREYFKTCVCDKSKYKYDTLNCIYPKTPYGDSCDGKFEFCGCGPEFRFDETNCAAPKVLSGKSCNGKYEFCSCPSAFYKTCTGNLVGNSESCDGRYLSCKCTSIFKDCSEGKEETSSICRDEQGVEKYSVCKGTSCENGGYLPVVPLNNRCADVKYFDRTCFKDCRPLTCFDGGYYDRNPSEFITCPEVTYGGKTCYDCDKICGYCERFTGECRINCYNDCKKGLWFDNRINGSFDCKI